MLDKLKSLFKQKVNPDTEHLVSVPKQTRIRYDMLEALYSYQPLIEKDAIKCEETVFQPIHNEQQQIKLSSVCAYITNINLRQRQMNVSVFIKSHQDSLYQYIQMWQQLQRDDASFRGVEINFDNIITLKNARLQYISDEITNSYVGYTKVNLVITMGITEYSLANRELKELRYKIKDYEKIIELIKYEFSDASLTLSSKNYNIISHITIDDDMKKSLLKYYKSEIKRLNKEIEKLLI